MCCFILVFFLVILEDDTCCFFFFFFFNDTATTEIYTLSLHDALPICCDGSLSCLAPSREFLTPDDLMLDSE